jgi:Domain of Unknown Function (DUF326)
MSSDTIVECRRCQEACLDTVTHALRRGGRYAEEDVVGTLLDATDVCRISIDFLRRGSPLRTRTCGVCAEICEAAADVCEGFADDQAMRACAEACRRCATACREIAAAGWLAA